ncbi:hypothetical protein BV22DRAFT_1195535 [Leucogyrophana mollusca]|uniref:Uncharacterized protein n=1 Tax=Leucogyrophana mollusca TaxID=85980 RepID=A0ACB8BI30_9AGAM|nr:hypothetical protein BV22DRAFT_1195535 [Leucogyrophana mollusca]
MGSLVGSVFERKPTTAPTLPSISIPASGFPEVQHRSKTKSAFARAREQAKKDDGRALGVPVVQSAVDVASTTDDAGDDALQRQISEENKQRLAHMTDEEREQERQDIIDHFGAGLLQKVAQARQRRAAALTAAEPAPAPTRTRSLDDIHATTPSKESRRRKHNHRLRFAEVTPQDVHVYESAPVSPKRPPLALPPPDLSDPGVISLGNFKHRTGGGVLKDDNPGLESEPDPEEGTPEDIRRRFFPHIPPNDPSVAWMQPPPHSSSSSNTAEESPNPTAGADAPSAVRSMQFDLSGTPVPSSLHADLHHHPHTDHTDPHHHPHHTSTIPPTYTLDGLFLLARSRVPAQRAAMLGALAGVARWAGGRERRCRSEPGAEGQVIDALPHAELDALRARILAAGLGALSGGSGSVYARAVEVVWTCIVGWEGSGDAGGEDDGGDDDDDYERPLPAAVVSTIALPFFLPLVTSAFALSAQQDSASSPSFPTSSSFPDSSPSEPNLSSSPPITSADPLSPPPALLLSVLLRLARASTPFAAQITHAPGLVAGVVGAFLGVGAVGGFDRDLDTEGREQHKNDDSRHRAALTALRLLRTLARASRANALSLVGPADALLRFVLAPARGPSALYPQLALGAVRLESDPRPEATARSKLGSDHSKLDSSNTDPAPSNPNPAQSNLTPDQDASLPTPRALAVLEATLCFYVVLARYGLYTHVAEHVFPTVSGVVAALVAHVAPLEAQAQSQTLAFSKPRSQTQTLALLKTHLTLLETWTTCAIDPHGTTPPHGLLWSQVRAWEWGRGAEGEWVRGVVGVGGEDMGVDEGSDSAVLHAALWHVEAAWLEGVRVNGVRGGEREREEALVRLRDVFGSGSVGAGASAGAGAGDEGRGGDGKVVRRAVSAMLALVLRPCHSNSHNHDHDHDCDCDHNSKAKKSLLQALGTHAEAVTGAIRLWLACVPVAAADGPVALDTPPFDLPFAEISTLCAKLVVHPLWGWSSRSSPHSSSTAHLSPHLRRLTAFLTAFHRLSAYIPHTSPALWLAQAFAVLPLLRPGDEEAARGMVSGVLGCLGRSVGGVDGEIPGIADAELDAIRANGGMDVLKPFLLHGLRPCGVSPLNVTPQSMRLCSTQRIPASSPPAPPTQSPPESQSDQESHSHPHSEAHEHADADTYISPLPLARTWLTSPLDHLLRSGSSPVFNAAEGAVEGVVRGTTDASETDVVRATLLLVCVAREVLVRYGLGSVGRGGGDDAAMVDGAETVLMSGAETVLACMKVFMLEHGQGGAIGEGEVFRDAIVGRLMGRALRPFMFDITVPSPASPSNLGTTTAPTPLEVAATPFLGPGTPFFQFYTDFLALYDAISFSHPLFGALLLAPTSMRYAVDYRRLLWCDYGHVVRTLRTDSVVLAAGSGGGGVGDWLWPVERSARVVGAYLGALVGSPGRIEGFVRLVAIHHVASNIWSDLRAGAQADNEARSESENGYGHESKGPDDEARAKLLRAVVEQGDGATVKEILQYRQVEGSGYVPPPACFEAGGPWREWRAEEVGRMLGREWGERLRGVVLGNS